MCGLHVTCFVDLQLGRDVFLLQRLITRTVERDHISFRLTGSRSDRAQMLDNRKPVSRALRLLSLAGHCEKQCFELIEYGPGSNIFGTMVAMKNGVAVARHCDKAGNPGPAPRFPVRHPLAANAKKHSSDLSDTGRASNYSAPL